MANQDSTIVVMGLPARLIYLSGPSRVVGVRGWKGRSRGRLAAECWVQDQTKMVVVQVTWGRLDEFASQVSLGLALEVWNGRWGFGTVFLDKEWHWWSSEHSSVEREIKADWKEVSLNVKRTALCKHKGNQQREVMKDWPKPRQTESPLTQSRTLQPHFSHQKKNIGLNITQLYAAHRTNCSLNHCNRSQKQAFQRITVTTARSFHLLHLFQPGYFSVVCLCSGRQTNMHRHRLHT